jgi:hypothetical protein
MWTYPGSVLVTTMSSRLSELGYSIPSVHEADIVPRFEWIRRYFFYPVKLRSFCTPSLLQILLNEPLGPDWKYWSDRYFMIHTNISSLMTCRFLVQKIPPSKCQTMLLILLKLPYTLKIEIWMCIIFYNDIWNKICKEDPLVLSVY